MSKPNGAVADALRYLDAHVADFTRELGDWVKSMRAAVHLYDELSRVPAGRRRRG